MPMSWKHFFIRTIDLVKQFQRLDCMNEYYSFLFLTQLNKLGNNKKHLFRTKFFKQKNLIQLELSVWMVYPNSNSTIAHNIILIARKLYENVIISLISSGLNRKRRRERNKNNQGISILRHCTVYSLSSNINIIS